MLCSRINAFCPPWTMPIPRLVILVGFYGIVTFGCVFGLNAYLHSLHAATRVIFFFQGFFSYQLFSTHLVKVAYLQRKTNIRELFLHCSLTYFDRVGLFVLTHTTGQIDKFMRDIGRLIRLRGLRGFTFVRFL